MEPWDQEKHNYRQLKLPETTDSTSKILPDKEWKQQWHKTDIIENMITDNWDNKNYDSWKTRQQTGTELEKLKWRET